MSIARKRADLRLALEGCVGPVEIVKLAEMLLNKSYNGDVKACRTILEFVLGKPLQQIEFTSPIKLYDIGKDVEEQV